MTWTAIIKICLNTCIQFLCICIGIVSSSYILEQLAGSPKLVGVKQSNMASISITELHTSRARPCPIHAGSAILAVTERKQSTGVEG